MAKTKQTLPEATASYKQDGLIPVTATTKFITLTLGKAKLTG
jgi:hypothetical protein